MWSLSNAFTSALQELDPVPQFKATAKLCAFLSQLPNRSRRFSQSPNLMYRWGKAMQRTCCSWRLAFYES